MDKGRDGHGPHVTPRRRRGPAIRVPWKARMVEPERRRVMRHAIHCITRMLDRPVSDCAFAVVMGLSIALPMLAWGLWRWVL